MMITHMPQIKPSMLLVQSSWIPFITAQMMNLLTLKVNYSWKQISSNSRLRIGAVQIKGKKAIRFCRQWTCAWYNHKNVFFALVLRVCWELAQFHSDELVFWQWLPGCRQLLQQPERGKVGGAAAARIPKQRSCSHWHAHEELQGRGPGFQPGGRRLPKKKKKKNHIYTYTVWPKVE